MITWDFRSFDSQVLVNPRLPAAECEKITHAILGQVTLPAHFWIGTSGSTGQTKWVALSKSAILTSAAAVNRHLESTGKDTWIHALPSFHVGGLGIWARASLCGARVAKFDAERWDARTFHAFASENQGTLSALVPTQIHDLVSLGLQAPPRLRAIVIGGGALDESLYLRARALGWPLLPSYGMTECCSQIATASLSSVEHPEYPAMELLSHVEAETDEAGRIRIRSESLLTGYATIETSGTGAPLVQFRDPKTGGWFTSEDFGAVEQGRIRVRGRSADFVKVGGEGVDLVRLNRLFAEGCRNSQPSIVLAVPDARLGHVIHLVVEGDCLTPETAGALSRFNEQVLPFERIRRTHLLPRIPRSPLGKILRSEILKLL